MKKIVLNLEQSALKTLTGSKIWIDIRSKREESIKYKQNNR